MTTAFGTMVLISGAESLLADREVNAIKERVLAEDPETLVNDVQAGDLDGGSFAEILGGSLFSSSSLAIIRDVGSLGAPMDEQLVAMAGTLAPETAVVLVHAGGQKGRGLLTKLKKAKVTTIECASVKPWELPQWVSGEARRAGVKMDAAAAESLVQAVGHDLRALAGAVSQLGQDSDGKSVTTSLVKQYFGGRAEVTSFNVADDVLAGRVGPALEKLRWAIETGVPAVLITSALGNALRGLGKFHEYRTSGMRQGELAAAIGVPPFKIKDLQRQARDWPQARIALGIQRVARADADVKGAAGSPEFTLERLVIDLARTT